MNYDIIGDIHGHAAALRQLLKEMGYRETGGAWWHPQRTALFVGDFIDRGPQQLDSVDLVRRMVDAGSAQAVMGNHEFNAIAWFTPDPEAPGEYLRRHHSARYGDKNREQHKAFLGEAEGTPRHKEVIDWFLTLPVYLDLPELRVVHACWHPGYIDYFAPRLTAEGCLTPELMIRASREPEDEAEKDTPEPSVFKAVETLLKGIEIPLPSGHAFRDKDKHLRTRVRVRWWESTKESYRDLAMVPAVDSEGFPDDPMPDHVRIGHDGGKPVFVGHYWQTGVPALLSDRVACVDYSVAKDGKLVAYRWEGEPELDAANFHWVGK